MRNYLKTFLLIMFSLAAIITAMGCESDTETPAPAASEAVKKAKYIKISPEEAREMMNRGGAVILDVRTRDEYNEAHISGAVLLPIDDVKLLAPSVLPDKSATILVHCRSGNRSERAAHMLIDMGYTVVYDFGGIQNWPYSIVTGK